MAEKTPAPAPAAPVQISQEDEDFARRAARAELDAARIEEERTAAVSAAELANYAQPEQGE